MSLRVQINGTVIYQEQQINPSTEALDHLSARAAQVWVDVSKNAHAFEGIIDQYNHAYNLKSFKGDVKVEACQKWLKTILDLKNNRQEVETRQDALRTDLMTWIQTDENSVNLSAFKPSIKIIDDLINLSDGIEEYDGFDGLNLSKSCVDSGPKTNVDKLRRVIEMDLEKETQKNQCAIL